MKRSKAYVDSRREAITELLEKEGQASVLELADHFEVSSLTIRRDLDFLEKRGILTRQYGIATLLNPYGRPSGSRQIRSNKAIAREAARYVEDGDCIFINTSSVALGMLEWIDAHDVTVVTNNGKALLLEDIHDLSIILTGGDIRPPRASMTGDTALECIQHITAAKCFLGCTGFSGEFGLTSATAPEPAINAQMLKRSRKHYVVADSSKLGTTSNFQFGSAEDIDLLITDTGANDEQIKELKAAGLKDVVCVTPSILPAK